MQQRYFIRTVCRDGRHRLSRDYATRQEAHQAIARLNARDPGLLRLVDSYMADYSPPLTTTPKREG